MIPGPSVPIPIGHDPRTPPEDQLRNDAAAIGAPGIRRKVAVRSVELVPNLVTLAALCCGLSAAKYAADGRVSLALGLIFAAALLDGLDGRLARLLGAGSRIGAELDSLCDAINFGVTPALITYFVIFSADNESSAGATAGWTVALFFAACMVLRLARFNCLLDEPNPPDYKRNFFVGVPAPAAAALALSPVIALTQFGQGWWSSTVAVSLWMLLIAGLSVSTVPTLSLKSLNFRPPAAFALVITALVALTAATIYPLAVILALNLVYLLHIPFAVRAWRWLALTPEATGSQSAARGKISISRRSARTRRSAHRRLAGRVSAAAGSSVLKDD